MSDETEVIETDAPETDAPAEASAEDRALTMGWTPKEQFKGDPERWVDAETFVKRGEEFLPFLKANNKRLEGALDRSEKKIASLEKTLKDFSEHHSKTEQRAYERAKKEIEERIAASASISDVQGVQAATAELVDLEKQAGSKAPSGGEREAEELFTDWKKANPWFDTDSAMRGAAIEIARELDQRGINGAARGEEITKRIKAEFPHKFENPNRRQPGMVEGGNAPPRKAGKTYSDLPPEARALCDDFVKRIPGFTRDKYVKEYFEQ